MKRTLCAMLAGLMMLVPVEARALDAPPDYRLSYGDAIAISSDIQNDDFVNAAPQLQNGRGYPIRPDGKVSLPLIGDVQVGGLTIPQVVETLEEDYRPYLGDAQFMVNVIKFHPITVAVIGEIAKAGAYDFDRPPTLLEALSEAGGPTDFAADSHVEVLHDGKVRYDVNLQELLQGKAPSVQLGDGDVVSVPTTWYKPYAQNMPVFASVFATIVTLMFVFIRVQ